MVIEKQKEENEESTALGFLRLESVWWSGNRLSRLEKAASEGNLDAGRFMQQNPRKSLELVV